MRIIYQILRYLHPSIDKVLGIEPQPRFRHIPIREIDHGVETLEVTVKDQNNRFTVEKLGTAYMLRDPKQEVAEGLARQERNKEYKRRIEEKNARDEKRRSLHLLKDLREQNRVPKGTTTEDIAEYAKILDA